MSRAPDAAKLAIVLLLALPVPAGAAKKPDPIDPETGSPSGFVYALPLDTARKDAAPAAPVGGSGGSSSGGSTETDSRVPIHSAAGFGSSPTVPGAPSTKKKNGSGSGTSGGLKGGGGASGTSGDGGGGGGGIGLPGGSEPAASSAGSGGGLPGLGDSAAGPLTMLGLAGLVGGGLAAAARRRVR